MAIRQIQSNRSSEITTFIRWIETIFPFHYKQREVPFCKLLNEAQAKALLSWKEPKYDPKVGTVLNAFRVFLSNSDTIFAVLAPDRKLYIHPDNVFKVFRKNLQKKLQKAMNSTRFGY